jgi:hypothetical protein
MVTPTQFEGCAELKTSPLVAIVFLDHRFGYRYDLRLIVNAIVGSHRVELLHFRLQPATTADRPIAAVAISTSRRVMVTSMSLPLS